MLGPGALLRSKTPELVQQELEGLMLAHYAVRSLIHEAAGRVGADPDRLSFLHTVNVVRRRIVHPGAFSPMTPPTAERDFLDEILEELAISSRGQTRSRGVKCKMGNYPICSRGPLSRKVHKWIPEICPIAP